MLGSLEAEKLGGSEARKFTINEINLMNPINQSNIHFWLYIWNHL